MQNELRTPEINENNKENKKGNNEEGNKAIQTVFYPFTIFPNPMLKTPKNFYGKYKKKKTRPFTERDGDWICNNCKNLNFAFRNKCNRCKISKTDCTEIIKNKEENPIENRSNNFNKNSFNEKKSFTNRNNNNKEQQLKDFGLNMFKNEKSFE